MVLPVRQVRCSRLKIPRLAENGGGRGRELLHVVREDPESSISPVRRAPGPDRIRDERCQIGFTPRSSVRQLVSIVQLKESDSLILCD